MHNNFQKNGFAFIAFALLTTFAYSARGDVVRYLEEFDSPGVPSAPSGGNYWYRAVSDNPQSWSDINSGNGFAQVSVSSSAIDNDGNYTAIAFGTIREGVSFEIRAAGLVAPGYVGHMFTYSSSGEEIDIELAADDTAASAFGGVHSYTDYTDARFNAFRSGEDLIEANYQPIRDSAGNNITHYGDNPLYGDGLFHTYTVDWYDTEIHFYIDGILQDSIAVDSSDFEDETEVIIGFRDLEFGGINDNVPPHQQWSGEKNLLIDYFRVGENGLVNTRARDFDEFAVLGSESITAVVPEPSFVGLLSLGSFGLLLRRDRRRRT